MRQEGQNHIVLSRRNLNNLLHMLDEGIKTRPGLVGDGFIVEAEEDDTHYAGRDYPAGTMSWEN